MSQIITFSHKYGLDKIDINTDVICHYLCSYIHWINIPVSFLIYSYNPNERNIADMIGVTTLSISSYLYHTDIYHRLSEKKIEKFYKIKNQRILKIIFIFKMFYNKNRNKIQK